MRRTIVIVALFLVVIAQRADSQNRTSITVTDSECVACGYKPFSPGVELATTQRLNSRFTLDARVQVKRARKSQDVGDGGFLIGGETALRIGLKPAPAAESVSPSVFLIGGVRATRQYAEFGNKTSVWPMAGIGIEDGNLTLSARYLFPDVTSPNRGQGVELIGERRWSMWHGDRGVLVKGSISVQRVHCIQGPVGLTRTCVVSYGLAGVGFYF
ncbi:MAG TPA: hypothetical protein VJU84_08495 [Pyrinomonadaceae bacterium]|nr:hypothetical protein [Pyrinomonadaceae bacterium]